MYGDGFKVRNARYRSSGADSKGTDRRCAMTTCMTSPSRMYARERSTAASKAGRGNPETKSSSATRLGTGTVRSCATLVRRRVTNSSNRSSARS